MTPLIDWSLIALARRMREAKIRAIQTSSRQPQLHTGLDGILGRAWCLDLQQRLIRRAVSDAHCLLDVNEFMCVMQKSSPPPCFPFWWCGRIGTWGLQICSRRNNCIGLCCTCILKWCFSPAGLDPGSLTCSQPYNPCPCCIFGCEVVLNGQRGVSVVASWPSKLLGGLEGSLYSPVWPVHRAEEQELLQPLALGRWLPLTVPQLAHL